MKWGIEIVTEPSPVKVAFTFNQEDAASLLTLRSVGRELVLFTNSTLIKSGVGKTASDAASDTLDYVLTVFGRALDTLEAQ